MHGARKPLLARLTGALLPPPVVGEDWQTDLQLYVFRFGCLVCALCIPAFGVLYRLAEPIPADPLWGRVAIGLGTLALFGGSFVGTWPRRYVRFLFLAACYSINAWYVLVAYASGFSANYTAGFFAVFVTGAMLLSLSYERVGPLLAYLTMMLGATAALLTLVPEPAVDGRVLMASLLMAALLVYVSVGTRLQMQAALREREAHAEAAWLQAEAARVEAEQMLRTKSAFLNNMSHEIRTPLTAIIGFAQVLAEEVPDDQRPLVAPIEQGGRRLLDTLNSVLDLARLQAGRYELHAEPVDAAEEAHALGALLRPMAARKGLALRVEAPPTGLPALADRSALQRVLTNLLSNAVKFTEAGAVTLSAEAVPAEAVPPDGEASGDGGPDGSGGSGWVRLCVRDTGRGIGAEFLPKLFEEFRQESTGLARSHEGSGLGLAITRQLVELMGGAIGVRSEAGAGSAFTVTLPAAPPPPDGGDGSGPAAAGAAPDAGPAAVAAPDAAALDAGARGDGFGGGDGSVFPVWVGFSPVVG